MPTAIENNPIIFSLLDVAKSSGWTLVGNTAVHESCNAGNLYLLNYPLTIGQTYRYSYRIDSITSGYVQASLGAEQTTAGLIVETGIATENQLSFFANGNCTIEVFVIEVVSAKTDLRQQNTIAFSEIQNKWTSFYSYIPESAFSLFLKTYSFYNGQPYVHEHNSADRCNFYGFQYYPIIDLSTNQQPTIAKTFIGVNYQSNQLLIAPSGVVTSTGQLSELISEDFVQAQYNDGSVVYDSEGLYQASFLRDMKVDIVNGPQLKGNWLTVELVAQSPSTPLNLFSTEILYVHSYQSIR